MDAANKRADDGSVLGDARVKMGAEVTRGSETWDGKSEPKSRGYVYGFAKGRYLYEPDRHVLTCDQTGSGKTRFQNIPTLDLITYGECGDNVIVSDVKNEMIELCGDAIAQRGYAVLLLDTQHPARGPRFNPPLKLVCDCSDEGDEQGAEQGAEDVAAAIVPDEQAGQGSHWIVSARGTLAAVLLLVAFSPECPHSARHMATVCRIINEGTEGEGDDPAAPLKALFRELPKDHPARAFASQFLSSGGNEMRSILSTLKVHLRMFSSRGIAWLTSASDIDPRGLLTEKTALFLHVMDEGPYNAIFSILFDQIYKAAYAVADENGGKLPRPLKALGDEWGNLPTVKSLPSLLSLARSLGITWMGSVQNIAQLNRYGERDGRKKILANCSVKVALKLGEVEDRQYFTELIDKATRHVMGTSSSRGATSSSSRSYSEHADDVIRQFEWVTRSPDKDGAIVVKQAENGAGKNHAGVFRAPLVDCTKTLTREHFDLGTPEHERAKRRNHQERLDEAATRRDMAVETWRPQWPEAEKPAPQADDEWSALDDRR